MPTDFLFVRSSLPAFLEMRSQELQGQSPLGTSLIRLLTQVCVFQDPSHLGEETIATWTTNEVYQLDELTYAPVRHCHAPPGPNSLVVDPQFEISSWAQALTPERWWPGVMNEGHQVRDFLRPAISMHRHLSVYDPYFLSRGSSGNASNLTTTGWEGGRWLIEQSLRAGHPSIQIFCKPTITENQTANHTSRRRTRMTQLRNDLRTICGEFPVHQDIDFFITVVPQNANFHDRCLTLSLNPNSKWCATFLIGTGTAAFSERGYPTAVGRTDMRTADSLVSYEQGTALNATMKVTNQSGMRHFTFTCPNHPDLNWT
jgi:hypothetical protein